MFSVDSKGYWNELYRDYLNDAVIRGAGVAVDMFKELKKHPDMYAIFSDARSVLEFGCGTGEMGEFMDGKDYLGLDISEFAIEQARLRHIKPNLSFRATNIFDLEETFSLGITSNTLEHFSDPHKIIDKMLGLCWYVLILVPYDQRDLEEYTDEGHAAHIFTFNEETMSRYNFVGEFKYLTPTWSNSVSPYQWLMILK